MVISILMIDMMLGFFGCFPLVLVGDCTAREMLCYPVLEFRRLRKSYNRLGSAILTGGSLLVYPAALIGVAVYGIAMGIVRSFNWAFKNREE